MFRLLTLSLLVFSLACNNQPKTTTSNGTSTIAHKHYELTYSPSDKALLILFPGGGTNAAYTKKEFNILQKAQAADISVLMMNFNRHLWIEQEQMEYLKGMLTSVVEEYQLNTDKVYIGGMSIGGTVSFSLSDYLVRTNSSFAPKGAFVVDSPIALFSLYESSLKDTKRTDFSEQRRAEPEWIVNYIEEELGGNEGGVLAGVEKVAPITLKTQNIDNIQHLKNIKIRIYTEPDSLWWQQERQTDFKSTNAYALQQTTDLLKSKNWQNISLIQTTGKGFRSNGDRHPHSWSIVDIDDLIEWILEK